jgi:hypothetical protein
MKKVIVKNLEGVQTHGGELEDPTSWIAEGIAANWWGLPERPEIGENGQPTGNILPAEYTVEVIDITAQVEQDRVNREALEYLASTDWMAIRASEGGKPMPEEVKQARAEARARIVR